MTYIIHSWIKSIFGMKQCGGSRQHEEARKRSAEVERIRKNIQNMVDNDDVKGLKKLYKKKTDDFGVYAYLTGAKGVETLEELAATKKGKLKQWIEKTATELEKAGEDGEPSPIYYAFVREQ